MVRDNFAVSCHSQFQVQAVRIGLKLPELSPLIRNLWQPIRNYNLETMGTRVSIKPRIAGASPDKVWCRSL